jgi:hypothetical protein
MMKNCNHAKEDLQENTLRRKKIKKWLKLILNKKLSLLRQKRLLNNHLKPQKSENSLISKIDLVKGQTNLNYRMESPIRLKR